MTAYERIWLLLLPFLERHYQIVHKALRERVDVRGGRKKILDVGGRKSNYTVGINADVDILDLPRESELQLDRNLGLSGAVMDEVKLRRSNIRKLILGDIKDIDLEDAPYDVVASVEVIEHDPEPEKHLSQLARFLKPDGILILTTPNGHVVKNSHPDHVKEYTKQELHDMLAPYFGEIRIEYRVKRNFFFFKSHGQGWYPLRLQSLYRMPWVFFCTMVDNVINKFSKVGEDSAHTLFVIAKKPMQM